MQRLFLGQIGRKKRPLHPKLMSNMILALLIWNLPLAVSCFCIPKKRFFFFSNMISRNNRTSLFDIYISNVYFDLAVVSTIRSVVGSLFES